MRSIQAALALLVLAVAWPASAAAQSETIRDQVKDSALVHLTGCDPADFHCHRHRSTDRTNRTADVIWARNTFTDRALTLTMKVRGMTTEKSMATYVGWEIHAAKRQGWSTQLLYDRGDPELDLLPIRGGHTCAGARAHVATHRHLFRLTLPTSCLGGSRWVRISESTMVTNRSGSRTWYDDPRQGKDLKISSGVAQEQLGPRLRRS